MHEKEIEKLQAEKRKSNASLCRSSTKSSALRTAPPTMKRENGASGHTGLSPVVQPSKASHH